MQPRNSGPGGPAKTVGLDHAVALTRNLSAASRAFEDLGFRLTPRSAHSELLGTENRCVMLEAGYLELLSIRAPTRANAAWRARLERGEGWVGLALATDDLPSALAPVPPELRDEPLNFSRPTDSGDARFSVAMLRLPGLNGVEAFFCQHHTPELVWRSDEIRQPNGAQALTGCRIKAPDAVIARRSLQLAGLPPAAVAIAAGGGSETTIDAVSIGFASLTAIRQRLARSSLTWRDVAGGLVLPAQAAFPFPLELRLH